MSVKLLVSLIFLILFYFGCDGGIEPQSDEAGFAGRIIFTGQWPDSVTRTHIVIFKEPLLSASDFSLDNIRFVSNEIPFGVTEYQYSSKDSSVLPGTGSFNPGEYAYVAVAQQSTPNVSLNRPDWFVVGLFYNEGDITKPGTLVIPQNTFIKDIIINCDFENPPPQPPGGN